MKAMIFVLALGFMANSTYASVLGTYEYTCEGAETLNRNDKVSFHLEINPYSLTTSHKAFRSGVVDSKYSPRDPRYKTYTKYVPAAKSGARGAILVEDVLNRGGKKLANGYFGGKLQWRVETQVRYAQYELTCIRTGRVAQPQPSVPYQSDSEPRDHHLDPDRGYGRDSDRDNGGDKWNDCKLGEIGCEFE